MHSNDATPIRLLKKVESCFESLSTNGFYESLNLFPFVLSLSKDSEGVFQ
jgi:hypothetical protein